jgi:hypothetical protein
MAAIEFKLEIDTFHLNRQIKSIKKKLFWLRFKWFIFNKVYRNNRIKLLIKKYGSKTNTGTIP